MKEISILLSIAIVGLSIILLYDRRTKRKVLLHEKLDQLLPGVTKGLESFKKLTSLKRGYFASYEKNEWQEANKDLYYSVMEFQDLSRWYRIEQLNQLREFTNYYSEIEERRNSFNAVLIDQELKAYEQAFDNIEGNSLDDQQRKTIIVEEDNNLCIAGAGSGKTTTIVGKIKYLLERYRVDPEKILLISYTRKAAESLSARVQNNRLKGYTFHKLGMEIISNVEGKKPTIVGDDYFNVFVEKSFDKLLKDPETSADLVEFFEHYLKPYRSPFEFESLKDYIQFLKDHNYRTYKNYTEKSDNIRTNRREIVKSIEEARIANWLLFNGFSYEYEKPYEIDTRTKDFSQYKPDFFVEQDGKRVYIEHYGIDKESNVPRFFADSYNGNYLQANQVYNQKIRWARETHSMNGTNLLETYSYEMQDGVLFKNLGDKLQKEGFRIRPLSTEMKLKIIKQNAEKEVDSLITLIQTFIILLKSNGKSFSDLESQVMNEKYTFDKQRRLAYLKLIRKLFDQYQEHLKERNERDFSDLINDAVDYLKTGKYHTWYSHIIIDEFQDISIGRYRLLEAIKNQNPGCKILAVGDDWQSIYRFAGSDISLFKNFEEYFGFTNRSKIETTYRFNEPLISLSSEFVLKNPNQTPKSLKGLSQGKDTNIQLISSAEDNDTDALESILKSLIDKNPDLEGKSIKILGRYSFDIKRIHAGDGRFQISKDGNLIRFHFYDNQAVKKLIDIQYLTIHKAKGLQADHIILLNANSGKYGFPSEMSDDPILNMLLSEGDQFENGEERRLFYVAMTRAKQSLHIISDKKNKSKFVAEIESEIGNTFSKKEEHRSCPQCGSGEVVLSAEGKAKNGSNYKFYGCSNYKYGCSFSEKIWS